MTGMYGPCPSELVLIDSEMEDEDDEETREWEMAQVQRAGGWKEEEPEKPVKTGYKPTPSLSCNRLLRVC
jgi:hypothetical protein